MRDQNIAKDSRAFQTQRRLNFAHESNRYEDFRMRSKRQDFNISSLSELPLERWLKDDMPEEIIE